MATGCRRWKQSRERRNEFIQVSGTSAELAGEVSRNWWKIAKRLFGRAARFAFARRGGWIDEEHRVLLKERHLRRGPVSVQNMLQCDLPRTFIAAGQLETVCRLGELDFGFQFLRIGQQKHTFAGLRNSVVHAVQERVLADVTQRRKHFACFLGNVVTAVVDHVWNVFHQDHERLETSYEVDIAKIKIAAWVLLECGWMIEDFAELGSTDSRKRLAGRSADYDVNRLLNWHTRREFGNQALGLNLCDVFGELARFTVAKRTVKIQIVRSCGQGIEFDRCHNLKTILVEAQGESAAP